MPKYINLISWTDQGIRNIKDAPQRIDAFKKAVEAAGGKVNGFYVTMGEYDIVTIVDFPSDEAVASVLLGTGIKGNIRTKTMRAFDESQFLNVLTKVQ
jgi:uncharacterized protein with GYD domain